MKRNFDKLPRSLTLRTYAETRTWMTHFANGKFNLLFLIGRPGLGKSEIARAAQGNQRHAWIECHATKMAVYLKLYEHRDEPVVIDDENTLIRDPGKLALMNSLSQTNPVKTLQWDSTTRILEERGVPPEFRTSSPVLIITNQLRNLNPLLFEPSPAEIHEAAADWFTDKEIYDFIGQWLPFIPELCLRDYVKARQQKAAGFDWRTLLHEAWKSSKLARVLALHADASFATEEERVKAFVGGGGSRPTYFRYMARLRERGVLPRLAS